MRGRLAALAMTGAALTATTGCITSTPSVQPSRAALPSLAPSLPQVATQQPAPPSAATAPASAPAAGATERAPTRSPAGTSAVRRPETAATHVPTSADLRRALLGRGDLAGFQVDNGSDGAGGGGCAALDTDFSSGNRASAQVLLFRPAGSTFIRERLRQLSVSGAQAALSRVRGAPRACSKFTATVAGLGAVTVTVDPLGTPRVGDETTAVRITMRPQVASIVAVENLVLARRGGTLIIVTHTGLSTIDDVLTSTAVARAYEKTQRVW